jgi:hypothetical protein
MTIGIIFISKSSDHQSLAVTSKDHSIEYADLGGNIPNIPFSRK